MKDKLANLRYVLWGPSIFDAQQIREQEIREQAKKCLVLAEELQAENEKLRTELAGAMRWRSIRELPNRGSEGTDYLFWHCDCGAIAVEWNEDSWIHDDAEVILWPITHFCIITPPLPDPPAETTTEESPDATGDSDGGGYICGEDAHNG